MANPKKLGVADIRKLPLKRFKDAAGNQYTAFFDEESRTCYIPNGDGDYTVAMLPPESPSQPEPSAAQAPEQKKQGQESDGKKKAPSSSCKNNTGGTEERQPLTKKQKGLLVGFIIFFAILLYAFFSSGILSSGSSDSVEKTDSEQSAGVNIEDLAASERYEVLIVSQNMYKGDIIKADNLTSCVFSKSEFAACGGAYTKDCLSAVTGMEITRFMPFGTVLTYDACYFPSDYKSSPWGRLGKGFQYLDVPVEVAVKDINSLVPGDRVKLTIKVDTTQKQKNDSDNSTVDGMEHSSAVSASTTTDTYVFADIQIVDALDANGNSIYEKYSGLFSVPAGFISTVLSQDYDAENISSLLPAYFRFIVTDAQKQAIGDFSKGSVSASLKYLSPADDSSLPMLDYYDLTKHISKEIINRYNAIQKEIEEAASNG